MTVAETAKQAGFEILSGEAALSREIKSVFCCDLLSFVMGRAPQDSAWVTVMGNVNAVMDGDIEGFIDAYLRHIKK